MAKHRTNDVLQPPSPPKPHLITTTHIENDIALSDVRARQSQQPSELPSHVRDTASRTPADRRLIRRASLDDSSDEDDQPLPQRVVVTAAMVHHREPDEPAPQLFATQLDNNDVLDRHTPDTQEIQRLVSQVNWDDVEIGSYYYYYLPFLCPEKITIVRFAHHLYNRKTFAFPSSRFPTIRLKRKPSSDNVSRRNDDTEICRLSSSPPRERFPGSAGFAPGCSLAHVSALRCATLFVRKNYQKRIHHLLSQR
ncbi:hypothetical protein NQ318_022603 [Aromia moschata]|uniref:Uncharacterized protein n=1 Tax=Aromia moschata TaxID=1265417 RepID=A0AAV8XC75_9CUCU|nr:hypothetical protein NQ318_022603 [Aromia moschata]